LRNFDQFQWAENLYFYFYLKRKLRAGWLYSRILITTGGFHSRSHNKGGDREAEGRGGYGGGREEEGVMEEEGKARSGGQHIGA
jgi:hypothetical protein